MIIKQSKAVKAYKSVDDLNHVKLSSGRLALQVYNLYQKLKKAYNFQIQEEQKILFLHPDFDTSIGGIVLTDKNEEERAKAKEELAQIEQEFKALSELDFELEDFEPFEIDLDAEPNLKISGEDIGNLENLITFK